MPDVTISSTQTGLKWQGGAAAPTLIIEAAAPFLTAAGIPVNNGGGPFRAEYATTINGSGYVVVPDVTLPSTEDSTVPDVTYFAYFQKSNVYDPASRMPFSTFGLGRGFRVPESPTTTTWEEIDANMGTSLPMTPGDRTVGNLHTTGDVVIDGDLEVGGNVDFAGVLTGNIGGATNIPGTPSGPAFESVESDASLWLKYQADGLDIGRFDLLRGDPGTSVLGVNADGEVDVFTPTEAVKLALAADVTPYANVANYLMTPGTDITTALQTLIDNIEAAGKDEVIFFPEAGEYEIGGGLQDTGLSNSQIVLPKRSATQIAITLRGRRPASNLGVDISTSGTVLKSTLASGSGAVIGVKTGNVFNRSTIAVYLEDLTVRTVANPTISAIDLRYVMIAMPRNLKIDSGQGYNDVIEPTTATSFGLRMPANNVVSQSHALNVAVAGFYNGIELNELAGGDRLIVVNCYQAVVVPACLHAIQANLIELINNTRNLVFTGGLSYLDVKLLSIEHTQDVEWYATEADIYDPSSFRRGYIGWHLVEQNVGPSTDLLVTGAYRAGLVHLDRPVSPLRSYFADGSEWGIAHVVTGAETLSGGTATVTLVGEAAFTDATSYICVANDITAANPVKVARISGTQFTLTGTGTDVITYMCYGS